MSKRRHNFGTKRFKEKSLFIFHARIALKSLILLFVRLIARGARIGKTHTHTHTHTDRQTKYCNPLAHARRGLIRVQEESDKRMIELEEKRLKFEQEQLQRESQQRQEKRQFQLQIMQMMMGHSTANFSFAPLQMTYTEEQSSISNRMQTF